MKEEAQATMGVDATDHGSRFQESRGIALAIVGQF
jgi:hypothetical protein